MFGESSHFEDYVDPYDPSYVDYNYVRLAEPCYNMPRLEMYRWAHYMNGYFDNQSHPDDIRNPLTSFTESAIGHSTHPCIPPNPGPCHHNSAAPTLNIGISDVNTPTPHLNSPVVTTTPTTFNPNYSRNMTTSNPMLVTSMPSQSSSGIVVMPGTPLLEANPAGMTSRPASLSCGITSMVPSSSNYMPAVASSSSAAVPGISSTAITSIVGTNAKCIMSVGGMDSTCNRSLVAQSFGGTAMVPGSLPYAPVLSNVPTVNLSLTDIRSMRNRSTSAMPILPTCSTAMTPIVTMASRSSDGNITIATPGSSGITTMPTRGCTLNKASPIESLAAPYTNEMALAQSALNTLQSSTDQGQGDHKGLNLKSKKDRTLHQETEVPADEVGNTLSDACSQGLSDKLPHESLPLKKRKLR